MAGTVVPTAELGKGIWVKRIVAVNGADNEVRGIGFQPMGRIRDWQEKDDADILVHVKVYVECAWRKPKGLPF